MMPATAMKLPSDSVDRPDRPWPTVQPKAVTPPMPISTAPTTWLAVSSVPAKPSQRKRRVASAMMADPAMTPATLTMPKLRCLFASLYRISQSSV